MYKQMNIFDFIDNPEPNNSCPEQRTMFEQLFEKIDNPVMRCANCLCQYCGNNVEELYRTVKPEEQLKPCFNCDECREYMGEARHKNLDKKHCSEFALSDYGANRNRKKFKIVK